MDNPPIHFDSEFPLSLISVILSLLSPFFFIIDLFLQLASKVYNTETPPTT
jgi:hypothetical protein